MSPKKFKPNAKEAKELLRSVIAKKSDELTAPGNIRILASYDLKHDNITIPAQVYHDPKDFVYHYKLDLPKVEAATEILLEDVRSRLIENVKVGVEEIINPRSFDAMRKRYIESANELLSKEFPQIQSTKKDTLLAHLINRMLGMGDLEFLFADDNLEEIVLNRAKEPTWVYHKNHGWLKTNIIVEKESEINNFASLIGRRVGRQITSLNPLMDARLPSGDRVNATLFPISTHGNTITIRKFARTPWTVVDFIDPKVNSLNSKVASLLWLGIQNELNILIAGGTGSGKTSMLNSLTPFIPPNQRIVTIEDTRELQLPDYLHWVPMSTRSPNPEGKGEITMLDLMVNSLRMRPDRILVGEVRRGKEAEVLFEAMHTGHAVYSTLHADNVAQTYRRLVNPPINIPNEMLESLHLILVQFRQRRLNIRRTFQVAEVELPEEYAGEVKIKFNVLYHWDAKNDMINAVNPSVRILEELQTRTGMDTTEIDQDLATKEKILLWMLKNNVRDITDLGKIVSTYYLEPELVARAAQKNEDPTRVINR